MIVRTLENLPSYEHDIGYQPVTQPGQTACVSTPPAEGARVAWLDVPQPVRAAIERICGSCVIEAQTQPGGFSPGVAARPSTGLWFALVIDDLSGRQPDIPWQNGQLDLVLAAVGKLAETLTGVSVEAPAISEYLGDDFTGWRKLSGKPSDDRIDPWSRVHLAELAALEATWAAHAGGDTLLHADIRADNLLLTDSGVMVVDWPHACRGAAFTDLVFFTPSVAMQGGPEPAALLARSPAGQDADPDAVRAVVCALAGYFTERSLAPPPPGLPTVRRFQAAQAEVARRWLAGML